MKHLLHRCVLLGLMLILPVADALAQAGTVQGRVTDGVDGSPLAGANVALVRPGTVTAVSGAAADADGRFEIRNVPAGTYELVGRFIGYQEARLTIEVAAGETVTRDIPMLSGIDLNPVTVTASRQAEKVLEAPASISVLEAQQVQQQSTLSTAEALRLTPGVDFAATGIDRQEIVLRGFNNAFSGAALVLTDYRRAAVASLGVNGYDFMPIAPLDIERVEVVRGPSSALYGPGGDGGVIHFFTKNPFQYPGTTLMLGGGERSAFSGALRHAGVVNDRFGYKIVGNYSRADEWLFDPADPHDSSFLSLEGPREEDYWKVNVKGTAQYLFTDRTSVTAAGGYSTSHNTYLSGIGTLQSVGFGYTFGQIRLNSGPLFVQSWINRNNAGDSYVYAIDPDQRRQIVDNGMNIGAQAQYDLDLMGGRQRFIFGTDYERTAPDTEGTIIGRNEGRVIHELGGYIQSSTALTPMLDLVLALRTDYNNVVEDLLLSPRAALVYKFDPRHSVRGTFNRAFSRPGTNSLFLDIEAARLPGGLSIRARGSEAGYTFQRNPQFEPFAGTDLIAFSLNPATFGQPQPVGLPIDAVYASVYAQLRALLLSDQPLPAPLTGLPAEQRQQLAFLLDPSNTPVVGFSRGRLGMLNVTTQQIELIDDVHDIEPLEQTTTQTFEVGYKGLLTDRLLVSVDVYQTRKENFIGPLLMETPFVLVPTLSADLQASMAAGFAGNPQLVGALQQFGLTPAEAAAVVAALAAGGLPDAGTPVAIVQPEEHTVPGELLMSYRNFGRVSLWGFDLAAHAILMDGLTVHGGFSYVSQNFFDAEDVGEPGTELTLALNAPQIKMQLGVDYAVPRGLRLGGAFRFVDEFRVQSGPYQGVVPSYALVDLGIGYDLHDWVPGMRFDILAQNLLDHRHRQFIGAPQMGRFTMARLTYNIQ